MTLFGADCCSIAHLAHLAHFEAANSPPGRPARRHRRARAVAGTADHAYLPESARLGRRETSLTALQARLAAAAGLARLAVGLAWAAGRWLAIGIGLLLILQALLRPAQLWLARAVVDQTASNLGLAGGTAWPGSPGAGVPREVWIALAAGALAAGQLFQTLTAGLQDLAADRLTGTVTGRLLQAANRWPGLARFEDPAMADDLLRVRRQAALSGLTLLLFGGRLVASLVTVAGAGLTLAGLQPLLPAGLALAALPQLTRQWEYHRRTGAHLYGEAAETRRLQDARTILLDPEPAKDVRLYGLGPFFRRQYDACYADTLAALDRLRWRLVLGVSLAGGGLAAGVGAITLSVVWAVAHGERPLGDLVLYGGAATLLAGALVTLAADGGLVVQQLAFLPALQRVLAAPPALPAGPPPGRQAAGGPAASPPATGADTPAPPGIVFDRVAFAYPERASAVLRDVSFTIAPGECVALVGRNGAGTSTVVKLLLRLYDPTAGRIRLDGVDLRSVDLDAFRRQVAVVFQDFARYELTVGENIGLGRLESLGDRPRLLDAAVRAGAAGLLARLPQGLETPLGRQLGGRELSGGEWQQLALARAFVRDARLLILDEPAATLDVVREHDLYTRFHSLTRGRTTLLISHRLATVRLANRILLLEQGTIREAGTHDQLLARGGAYARLYRLQAAQYGAGEPPATNSTETTDTAGKAHARRRSPAVPPATGHEGGSR
jgi:ATP-binding cassette subfamily B protein